MPWWTSGKPGMTSGVKSVPRQVEEWIDSQPADERGKSWHVSGLAYLCARQQALQATLQAVLKPEKAFDAKMLHRFDVGTSVHWWWQNKYLGPMGKLLGTWVCVGCRTKVEGKQPQVPHDCGARAVGPGRVFWEYKEPRVSHQEPSWSMPLVGHPDGVIEDTPPEGELDTLGLIELKTKRPDLMPVTEIEPHYLFQAQVYMWLSGRRWCKFVFIDPAGVFYNPNLTGTRLPCQEITVKYDDSYRVKAIEAVNACEEALTKIEHARKNIGTFGEWPTRVCPDKQCHLAKRCGVKNPCFDEVLMERMAIRLREGRDPTLALIKV